MATYHPNQAGIRALENTPAMARAMREIAERVADQARAIAPVQTGQYKASIEASVVARDGKQVGRVTADPVSPDGYHYAAAVEFGTEDMEGQRPLGRALDALKGTP